MKKLLFILSLIIGLSSVNAQMQKGTNELDGSFSFSSSEQTEWISHIFDNRTVNRSYFYLNPKIGWFISESSVLGFGLGYHFNKTTYDDSDNEYKTNMFSIRPYFRNYQKITDKLFYTTTVTVFYGIGKEEIWSDKEADLTEYGISASPGITYFLSDKWAIKTTFGKLHYKESKSEIDSSSDEVRENKTKDLGFELRLDAISFGASFYF